MSKFYNHLSLNERRKIYSWREEKVSVNDYTHLNAQEFYRRRRQKQQKVESVAGLELSMRGMENPVPSDRIYKVKTMGRIL